MSLGRRSISSAVNPAPARMSAALGAVSTARCASPISVPSMAVSRSSSEEFMRLGERLLETVHLLAQSVEAEGGPAGGGHAEAREQRLGAVRAGPDRDPEAVEHGGHVVRMGAGHVEGENRALLPGGAEDAQAVDLGEPVVRVAEQRVLVGADA